eukprot:SAG31_NODE_23422_length_504_cov_3.340741_1_plen_58_part_10
MQLCPPSLTTARGWLDRTCRTTSKTEVLLTRPCPHYPVNEALFIKLLNTNEAYADQYD